MTAKKEVPAKRGRKAAPADQRTEPFTIRLTPKIRYGIDLLARAQKGRSLSQVVEWAIQRGLNSVRAGPARTLGEVLDTTWPLKSEWVRLRHLLVNAPDLLDFVEKEICEAILGSHEYRALMKELSEIQRNAEKPDEAPPPGSRAKFLTTFARSEAAFDQFITDNWTELKSKLVEREAQGKPSDGIWLTDLLEIDFVVRDLAGLEKLSRMRKKPSQAAT